ncbi:MULTISPECIES: TorF family putative porin [unclassified Novosphingobium]|uniref:TorF family putative porin n=1 Tax=unclassified Novosphingobium TaxID=2644732 RepID=UPI00135B1EDC|nr:MULTISPECIES: TorF family putative porin [unclassified Novosphingobium]
MNYRFHCLVVALCGGLVSFGAQAQTAASVSLEAETDHRERGLSWSDGKPALSASVTIPVTYDLALDVEGLTLRDSARHGGADLGLTIAPRYTVSKAGWDFTAGARGHVFVGRAGTSYVEVTGDVSHTIGPVQLAVGAAFAPSQGAIGGHNLYLDAAASISIPGTPMTVYGGIGRTSGSSSDDARALRLRPGGNYTDHRLGIEHTASNLAVGLRYSDTSISQRRVDPLSPWYDRHFGARVVAYVRFTP